MISALQRPYRLEINTWLRVRRAFFFGLFVFLFLWLFAPFGLDAAEHPLLLSVGFGMITFLAMLVLNVFLPFLLTTFFREEYWTVWKEIFWTTLNLTTIGSLNYLFFFTISGATFNGNGFLWFQSATLMVGLIPITFFTLKKEREDRHVYEKAAAELGHKEEIQKELDHPDKKEFSLLDQSGNIVLQGLVSNLYYIRAEGNYLEVFHTSRNKLERVIVRNTLKDFEDQLRNQANFIRIHKSYIVAKDKVKRVSGNAQGFRLHLENIQDPIPVSRSKNEIIKQLFP